MPLPTCCLPPSTFSAVSVSSVVKPCGFLSLLWRSRVAYRKWPKLMRALKTSAYEPTVSPR
jgi:hypothetical protein